MKRHRSGFALVLALLGGLLVALPAVAADELFVSNAGLGSVTVYSRTASGDAAPLRTLSGPATGLSFVSNLAVDVANNELFVAVLQGPAIKVYSLNASGNTAPIRTLSTVPALSTPLSLTLDLTNDELIVGTSGSTIDVYSRAASGNTPAKRSLGGAATLARSPPGSLV